MIETSFVVAFLGGMAALFSPCAAMLLPSFFAFAFARVGTLMGRCLLFYVGLLATMVPMGVAAGSLGRALVADQTTLLRIGAVVLVVLGLVAAAGWTIPVPGRSASSRRDPASPLAILVLGASYGLASGCTGPILGSVLTLAAMGGRPLRAAALMVVFAAGMVVPLLVLALLWDRLGLARRSWLRPRPVQFGPISTTLTQLVTGGLFIVLGAFLLLTGGQVGGLFDAQQQFDLEQRITTMTSLPTMLAVLFGVVGLVGLVTWAWLDEHDRAR